MSTLGLEGREKRATAGVRSRGAPSFGDARYVAPGVCADLGTLLVGRREEFSGPWVVGCDARGEELEAAYVCTWLAEIVCTRQHRPCEGCGHSRLAVGEVDEAAHEWLRVGDVQLSRAASPVRRHARLRLIHSQPPSRSGDGAVAD
jgi:hypothetical protein